MIRKENTSDLTSLKKEDLTPQLIFSAFYSLLVEAGHPNAEGIRENIEYLLNHRKNVVVEDIEIIFGGIYESLEECIDNSSGDIKPLKSIIPEVYIAPNSKLMNEITKDFINQGTHELLVGYTGKKKEIKTYATISYEGENIIMKGKEFTPYDRIVHNAVCSLYSAGNIEITPEMVSRAMLGKRNSEYIHPETIKEVSKSLFKSTQIIVWIDFTEEANARGIEGNPICMDRLLPARGSFVTINGVVKSSYKLQDMPILYQYSANLKQVISVPMELLDLRNKIKFTTEVIIIRDYLIRRIEGMKGNNSLHSNKILYASIFEELQIDEPTNEKSKKIRDHAKKILEYWIEKKYINNFQEYKEGKTLKGLEIYY